MDISKLKWYGNDVRQKRIHVSTLPSPRKHYLYYFVKMYSNFINVRNKEIPASMIVFSLQIATEKKQ